MIATQTIERRLAKIEQKLMPRLTEVEAYLCDCPEFVQLIADCGLNVDELRQRGNVIGSLPRDLLVLIVDRLNALSAAISQDNSPTSTAAQNQQPLNLQNGCCTNSMTKCAQSTDSHF